MCYVVRKEKIGHDDLGACMEAKNRRTKERDCRDRFRLDSLPTARKSISLPALFSFFLPLGLGLFPLLLLTTMHHPRIHTSPVFYHNPSPIKERISLRSTKHSQQIPSPIAVREWVRRWWAGDECFVCLITDLEREDKKA